VFLIDYFPCINFHYYNLRKTQSLRIKIDLTDHNLYQLNDRMACEYLGIFSELTRQKKTSIALVMVIFSNEVKFGKKKSNPDLTGDQTVTKTISLNLCVGDVWVSKNEVKAGQPDIAEDWVRLTSVTNREHLLFEDYSFPEIEIPIGEYKSVRLSLKNVFYHYAVLLSDSTVSYELLETMGSYEDPCDLNDTSWIDSNTNYFSADGNHRLVNGIFQLDVAGEKLTGFNITDNQNAAVTWRLGAGLDEPCTTTLHDVNGNRKWDCGIDTMSFWCPPEVKYM